MIGLTSVTLRQKSCEDILTFCQESGVQAIEWGGDLHIKPGDLIRARDIGDRTRHGGIQTFSYGSYYRLGSGDIDQQAFKIIAETALALGAEIIRIWTGSTQEGKNKDLLIEENAEELIELCRIASKYKLVIGLEYHRNTLTEDAEDLLTLLNKVQANNLKTYWQPNPELSLETHLKEINLLKDHICCMHTFYWLHNGGLDTRRPLKEGLKSWQSYVYALNNPQVPLLLEFVQGDSLEQCYEDMASLTLIEF